MAADATEGNRDSTLSPLREKLFLLALFCSLTLFAVLCTNFPTWSWPGGDGRDYANITEALVEGQSFYLADFAGATRSTTMSPTKSWKVP